VEDPEPAFWLSGQPLIDIGDMKAEFFAQNVGARFADIPNRGANSLQVVGLGQVFCE